jgi:signal transduction histidine kinase
LLLGAVVVVVLALSGGAFYLAAAHVSRQAVERSLASDARRLAGSDEFLQRISNTARSEYARTERYARTCFRIVSIIHDLTVPGEFQQGLPLSPEGLQALKQGKPWSEVTQVADVPVMVYNEPVAVNRRLIGVAQVAQPVAQYEQLLGNLRNAFTLGGGALLVIVLGALWCVVGITLRPLARIVQAVSALAARPDLTCRVEQPHANHEVGRLARTLNAMLSTLQGAHQQLEHNLEAQRHFVADASHELRTPLTTIRGNLGLLRREDSIDPQERQEILHDAIEESERMARLIDELLLVARTDTGRMLRHEPVALAPLIEDVCRKVAVIAPDRHLAHGVGPDVIALGDAEAIKQVLLILLDNAFKFTTPDGHIGVTATLEDRHVLVQVRDDGAGIDAASLPHVFDRFYRAELSTPGNGLGLSIARRLVEAQGGTISVASRRGFGSVFTILLLAT